MFGKIVDFFKALGHVLAKVFGIIQKIVPEEQLVKGIELVRLAADKFAENALRREWVIQELTTLFHLPESVARLIVEMAVQHVKHDVIDAGAQKVEDVVAQPPPA